MPTPDLSVVICTHNPRADFLSRTLAGLRAQTLPLARWELVVVDNASRPPLAARLDLSWRPDARITAETEVGLTAARLHGIDQARGEVILFVDDDNVLAPDYLERAVTLASTRPDLGVWGCGNFTPEWEAPPSPAVSEYLGYLAVHRAPRDRWSNQLFDYAATPAGAGLCVRQAVARSYAASVRSDPRRKQLDRSGSDLSGCGDFDLAFTAIALGLGTGVFTDLAITHLMPKGRVEEPYLLRLVEGHAFSTVFLHAFHQPGYQPPRPGWLARLRRLRYRRTLSPAGRRIHDARLRGEARAAASLSRLPSPRA